MKVLFIGVRPEHLYQVELAVKLRWPDTQVLIAENVASGIQVLEHETPDIAFIECAEQTVASRWLADAINEIRAVSDVPLVVLDQSRSVGDMNEIQALEIGADDYIHMDGSLVGLVARLVALMRRVWRSQPQSNDQVLLCGPLLLNPATYEVFLNNVRLRLTGTEFRLLHLLLKNRGAVVSHRVIELSLWGDRVDRSALVKKYIQRLRRKLGQQPDSHEWIVSVHGVGYRLVPMQQPLPLASSL